MLKAFDFVPISSEFKGAKHDVVPVGGAVELSLKTKEREERKYLFP